MIYDIKTLFSLRCYSLLRKSIPRCQRINRMLSSESLHSPAFNRSNSQASVDSTSMEDFWREIESIKENSLARTEEQVPIEVKPLDGRWWPYFFMYWLSSCGSLVLPTSQNYTLSYLNQFIYDHQLIRIEYIYWLPSAILVKVASIQDGKTWRRTTASYPSHGCYAYLLIGFIVKWETECSKFGDFYICILNSYVSERWVRIWGKVAESRGGK